MPAALSAPPPSWCRLAELASEPMPESAPSSEAFVCVEALPDTVAMLRLGTGMPECVRSAARSGQFCVVVQEPAAATAWVPRRLLPGTEELTKRDGAVEPVPGANWCALRISHPGPAKNGSSSPAELGVAGTLCAQIAHVASGARVLSPFGTEVLLVPESQLQRVVAALVSHGHAISPCSRLCDAEAWRQLGSCQGQRDGAAPRADPGVLGAAMNSAVSKRLAGVWNLVHREEPPGTIVNEYAEGEGSGAVRLQVPSGLFVEVRIPTEAGGKEVLEQQSFAGRCRSSEGQNGQVLCTQFRSLDFQPASLEMPSYEVTVSYTALEVANRHSRELWAQIGTAGEQNFAALELHSESPAANTARAGLWLFAGRRFARFVGPPRGVGIVASTCCKSIGQLQRLRGAAETTSELRECYEVIYGVVEDSGVLRTTRAWPPSAAKAGDVYFRAGDPAFGDMEVGAEFVSRKLLGGKRETWRKVEWTFNPFARPDHLPALDEVDLDPASRSSSQTHVGSQVSDEEDGDEDDAAIEFGGCLRSPSRASAVEDSAAVPAGDTNEEKEEKDDEQVETSIGEEESGDDDDAAAVGAEGGADSQHQAVMEEASDKEAHVKQKKRKKADNAEAPKKPSKKEKQKRSKDAGEKSKKKLDKTSERRPLPSVSPGKPLSKPKKSKKEKKAKEKKPSERASRSRSEQLDVGEAEAEAVKGSNTDKKKKKKKDKEKDKEKEKSEKKAKKQKVAEPESEDEEDGTSRGRGRSPALQGKPGVGGKKRVSARKCADSDASGDERAQTPPRVASPSPKKAPPVRQALPLAAKALQEVRAKAKMKKNRASLKPAVAVAAASPSPPRKTPKGRSRSSEVPDTKSKHNGRCRSESEEGKAERRKRSPSAAARRGSRNAFKATARSRSPPARKANRSRSAGGKARRKAR